MNALTVQGMGSLSAPLTVEIDHGDAKMRFKHELRGLGQPQTDHDEFGFDLSPTFAPWWKEIPGRKDDWIRTRRTPERGELFKAQDAYRPAWPTTPSNDERNLPTPSGKPLVRLEVRKFTRTFPHTTIDYSQLSPQVGPEDTPMPSGWMPPPRFDDEEARAVNAVVGSPAAYPEDMTTDISGFGSLHEAFFGNYMADIPGIVVSLDDPPAQAATAAVAQQAAAAQAAGAAPSVVAEIINFGSQAASLYLQQRAIEKAKAAQPSLLAKAQALGTKAYTTLFAPEEPFYKKPLFIGGVALLAVSVGALAMKGGKGGGRRRSTTRRRRR